MGKLLQGHGIGSARTGKDGFFGPMEYGPLNDDLLYRNQQFGKLTFIRDSHAGSVAESNVVGKLTAFSMVANSKDDRIVVRDAHPTATRQDID
ncbi:MAG: hypothetical protein ACYTEL_15475 [Planctomycetota bacterium]